MNGSVAACIATFLVGVFVGAWLAFASPAFLQRMETRRATKKIIRDAQEILRRVNK